MIFILISFFKKAFGTESNHRDPSQSFLILQETQADVSSLPFSSLLLKIYSNVRVCDFSFPSSDLSNNQISSIAGDAFHGLRSLTSL